MAREGRAQQARQSAQARFVFTSDRRPPSPTLAVGASAVRVASDQGGCRFRCLAGTGNMVLPSTGPFGARTVLSGGTDFNQGVKGSNPRAHKKQRIYGSAAHFINVLTRCNNRRVDDARKGHTQTTFRGCTFDFDSLTTNEQTPSQAPCCPRSYAIPRL